MQKGKIFYNVIIGIIVLALIGAIAYTAYYYINKNKGLSEAEDAVSRFENSVIVVAMQEEQNQPIPEPEEPSDSEDDSNSVYYRGYEVIGIIEIPRTGVRAPIVDRVTTDSIALAVGVLYGPGLNQPGNTVLAAHNYRDGTFFSNNKNLGVGDKIYITDITGTEIEYAITKSYITGETDFEYAVRNTNGKREISLSTCTTDPTKRLVIWAKET